MQFLSHPIIKKTWNLSTWLTNKSKPNTHKPKSGPTFKTCKPQAKRIMDRQQYATHQRKAASFDTLMEELQRRKISWQTDIPILIYFVHLMISFMFSFLQSPVYMCQNCPIIKL
jgi:hypothetical protein